MKTLRQQVEDDILKWINDHLPTLARLTNFSVSPDEKFTRGTDPEGNIGFVCGPVFDLTDKEFKESFILLSDALFAWFMKSLIEEGDEAL